MTNRSAPPAHEEVPVRAGVAERLSRMIQLPTVSAELEARGRAPFDAFIDLLEELYPLVHRHLGRELVTDFGYLFHWPAAGADTDDTRSGSPAADPLVLMAHYDVVPVDENDAWTHPPFAGVVADGFVYGRGALDDKGPMLVVLEAVENLLATGYQPARDIYLSFGGNEETFGDAAQVIAKTLNDRGITPWLVIDEGGAVTDAPLPFVSSTAAMVGVGEKGIATVRLSAFSSGGHASSPPKLTAVGRISRAVTKLTPQTFPARSPKAISRMLRLFSNRSQPLGRALYRTLAAIPWLSARVFAALGGEPAAMVRTTIAPTMVSGGTAANVLPSQASVTINLRIALGENVAQVAQRIEKRIADPLVTVDVVEGNDPSPESLTDNEQFALIARAVGVSHPDAMTVPYVVMAATDSRYFHRYSTCVYRFAPLTMDAELRATIHGVDERVRISELVRGELFHRALITSIPPLRV